MDAELGIEALRGVKTFSQLKRFLEDEMDWPFGKLEIEDLMFDYKPEELGIKPNLAAKIKGIKRLRSLSVSQPWGIFFIEFESWFPSVPNYELILRSISNTLFRNSNYRPNKARRFSYPPLSLAKY